MTLETGSLSHGIFYGAYSVVARYVNLYLRMYFVYIACIFRFNAKIECSLNNPALVSSVKSSNLLIYILCPLSYLVLGGVQTALPRLQLIGA
jgi:hypothetical protein